MQYHPIFVARLLDFLRWPILLQRLKQEHVSTKKIRDTFDAAVEALEKVRSICRERTKEIARHAAVDIFKERKVWMSDIDQMFRENRLANLKRVE